MKLKKMLASGIVFSIVILYFCNAKTIVSAVKESLFLCYNTIIPSLFVFMVISSFLSCFKSSEILSIPFSPLFRLLNITDKKLITYCVLSILGGFATGGLFLNRISRELNCDKNLNYVLTVLTSNNSPAFIIVAVGLQMLGSLKTGVLLYIAVITSCYITAFVISFILPYDRFQTHKTDTYITTDISDAIKYAVTGILTICGVVIFASTVCKVVQLYTNNSAVSVAFSVICEVTNACNYICSNFGKNLYLICIAVVFFPLSAYFQMKSFDENKIYSFKILFISKIFQIPIAICILRILVNLFPVSSSVYANGDIKINMYWNSPHISIYLLIMSLCFVIMFDKKTGVFTKTNK